MNSKVKGEKCGVCDAFKTRAKHPLLFSFHFSLFTLKFLKNEKIYRI